MNGHRLHKVLLANLKKLGLISFASVGPLETWRSTKALFFRYLFLFMQKTLVNQTNTFSPGKPNASILWFCGLVTCSSQIYNNSKPPYRKPVRQQPFCNYSSILRTKIFETNIQKHSDVHKVPTRNFEKMPTFFRERSQLNLETSLDTHSCIHNKWENLCLKTKNYAQSLPNNVANSNQ